VKKITTPTQEKHQHEKKSISHMKIIVAPCENNNTMCNLFYFIISLLTLTLTLNNAFTTLTGGYYFKKP
jgi:hypothetical protein